MRLMLALSSSIAGSSEIDGPSITKQFQKMFGKLYEARVTSKHDYSRMRAECSGWQEGPQRIPQSYPSPTWR